MRKLAAAFETIPTLLAVVMVGWFVNPGGLRCPLWVWHLSTFWAAFVLFRLIVVWWVAVIDDRND